MGRYKEKVNKFGVFKKLENKGFKNLNVEEKVPEENKYVGINKQAFLWRLARSDQGTEGMLFSGGFYCKTLELPWRDNQRGISCIPAGEYPCVLRQSPKFGTVYWAREVPERSYILIHSGNWAGDKSLGYKTHVQGCILLGEKHGLLAGQRAVLNSRVTLRRFMFHMENKPFMLKIIEYFG